MKNEFVHRAPGLLPKTLNIYPRKLDVNNYAGPILGFYTLFQNGEFRYVDHIRCIGNTLGAFFDPMWWSFMVSMDDNFLTWRMATHSNDYTIHYDPRQEINTIRITCLYAGINIGGVIDPIADVEIWSPA